MVELLDRTGEAIARLLDVEAARITPGASAAIALGIGACLTGDDREKMERLPETAGMPNEVILQRGHRYKYDRRALMPGARIVDVGSEAGTRGEEIEQAIGPNSVALFVPAHLDGHNGTVALVERHRYRAGTRHPYLRRRRIPELPLRRHGQLRRARGRSRLLQCQILWWSERGRVHLPAGRISSAAVAALDFTRHESGPYRRFGRAFKMDRQTVVATVVALEEWLAMDHDARWQGYRRQVENLLRGVGKSSRRDAHPDVFHDG